MQDMPYLDKRDPYSSHSLMARWLAALPPGAHVLDVGTATGTLGRLCQSRGWVLRGVEPNPDWADTARPLYSEIRVGLLEQVPDDFLGNHQAVICADVLEHMPDPLSALRRLISLQPEGGLFLISVPNVANLWVRLSLLFGRFEYAERGILDRTHLRFFTRRSFLAMLREAGLAVERVQPTPIPLNLIHPLFERSAPGRAIFWLLNAATRALPGLLGYQFVAYCHKPCYGKENDRCAK